MRRTSLVAAAAWCALILSASIPARGAAAADTPTKPAVSGELVVTYYYMPG